MEPAEQVHGISRTGPWGPWSPRNWSVGYADQVRGVSKQVRGIRETGPRYPQNRSAESAKRVRGIRETER